MKKSWSDAVITEIAVALYVPANRGKHNHKDRSFHGLVINDSKCVRDYYFADGTVLYTGENALFYLPKGSSYEVKTICDGGCYAINFDADVWGLPFAITPKNPEQLKKAFKTACEEWRLHRPGKKALAMAAIYDAIAMLLKEGEQPYLPSTRHQLIEPAVSAIDERFSDPELSVAGLAALCGISEVYLRKIFISRFGISPKEYIIGKRMDYARQLLASGQFEIRTVAELCGYAEPCHFSREFKRSTGIAPKHYK